MTLLEEAKKVDMGKRGKNLSEESIELALSWLSGEITLRQVKYAFKTKANSPLAYVNLAIALRKAYQIGKISKNK